MINSEILLQTILNYLKIYVKCYRWVKNTCLIHLIQEHIFNSQWQFALKTHKMGNNQYFWCEQQFHCVVITCMRSRGLNLPFNWTYPQRMMTCL